LLDLPRFAAGFLRERVRRLGTLPPARRACDSPIAIACFLLVTFLPERPLRSVPRLRSFIAFLTLVDAFLPYLAMSHSLDLGRVDVAVHRATLYQKFPADGCPSGASVRCRIPR
jgi:hypothetical protein